MTRAPAWISCVALMMVACTQPSKEPAAPPDDRPSPPTGGESADRTESNPESPERTRELLIDLAASRLCERVEGKLLTLSSAGASAGGAASPAIGVLWVERCDAAEVDPRHLRLQIGGSGWRWLSREESRAGAEFEIDQYVRFAIDVSMVATADLAYAPRGHIVTAWLLPTEPVRADLTALGDIEVDTESLWADIVGGAASLVGEGPGARAEEQLEEKGGERFEQKLAEGFSLAVNLCTGRRVTHLGTLERGEMPEIPLDPKGQLQEGSGRVTLHDGGLMMFGPFPGERSLVAEVAFEGEGAAGAELLCEADAWEMYRAFLRDRALPDLEPLAGAQFRAGGRTKMRMKPADCPVVLAMRPVEGAAPVSLAWTVYHPGAGFEPIVECR